MFKTLFASLALAMAAWGAGGVIAPQAAYADACTDLQAIVQHPVAADTAGPGAAAQIGAHAQELLTSLCPNGAAADASAPTHTPAQLADASLASACPAYADPPQAPPHATRAQVEAFNAWAAANKQTMDCHHQEISSWQREAAVYDAAALVWQQHFIAQVVQLEADMAAAQAAYVHANAGMH